MAATDSDLGSTAFFNPGWIAANGGWIHSNNVLFYFMESPFFDRTSTNQSVVTQNAGIPEREYAFLSTRKKFEQALSMLVGLQYVVAHDPLESNVKVDGSNGPEQSETWVIRKQYRSKTEGKEDDISTVGFYYITNQTIYQAPSIAKILSYRMLNTTLAMNNFFSTASSLPVFTASHGHAYHKPVQKTVSSAQITSQQSKENTPMPQARSAEHSTTSTDQKAHMNSSTKTLYDALQMTMRYGKEYMDDMPLVGEPGNFRFSKVKDSSAASSQARSQNASQSTAVSLSLKAETPAASSRVISPPSLIQTDVPPVQSKKSSAKSPDSGDHMKPRRRKSKAANQSP